MLGGRQTAPKPWRPHLDATIGRATGYSGPGETNARYFQREHAVFDSMSEFRSSSAETGGIAGARRLFQHSQLPSVWETSLDSPGFAPSSSGEKLPLLARMESTLQCATKLEYLEFDDTGTATGH